MEDTLKLKAEKRENSGTKVSQRLRSQGKLPIVLYGHKQQTFPLAVDMHDFVEGVHHGHRLMELEVDGKNETTMIKDIQYDYLGRDIIHADMIRVNITERVTVSVALDLKGEPKGAQEGGILEEHADGLEVECRVSDIPETIEVSVDDMEIGDALYARDVKLPEGIDLASDEDTLIVICRTVEVEEPEEAEALEGEEEPSAPEVIGREKEDQEDEGEQEKGGE